MTGHHKKKKTSTPTKTNDAGSSTADGDDGEGTWECSVCTYRNKFEAFKCDMCDTRKGTSTRKPRLNQNVVAQQTLVQNFVLQQTQAEKQLLQPVKMRRRTLGAGDGSPSTSRHSPDSTSSGSQAKQGQLQTPASLGRNGGTGGSRSRPPIPINDELIVRSSPRRVTVEIGGVAAEITVFRKRAGDPMQRLRQVMNQQLPSSAPSSLSSSNNSNSSSTSLPDASSTVSVAQ